MAERGRPGPIDPITSEARQTMTREDGRDPIDPDTSNQPTKVADAEAATVLAEEAEAATVLAEEDDRTQVVSGRTADPSLDETILDDTGRESEEDQPTVDSLAATRVIDPETAPGAAPTARERAAASRDTRVLDVGRRRQDATAARLSAAGAAPADGSAAAVRPDAPRS